MKNVLFLSYHFPPIGGAPVQRSLKFVRYLLDEGYRPVVVTGRGDYHNEWTPLDPSLSNEVPSMVPVYRVKTPIPNSRGRIVRGVRRWLGLQQAFSGWWIRSAIEIGKKAVQSEGAQVIYASMSPFETADVAWYLSRMYGIPWVADLRDPWAIDELQVYPSFIHKKLAVHKMHRLLSSASVILMNTPEASACLLKHFPDFRAKRVVTITNGFDPQDFVSCKLPASKRQKKFTIVHAGSFLTDSGLLLRRRRRLYEGLGGAVPGVDIATRSHLVLFEAIHCWCEQRPEVRRHLEIVFAGSAPRLHSSSTEEKDVLKMTSFEGYLSRDESLGIVLSADLLFLAMHNLPSGRRSTSAPSKMYEYMASGRPILAAVPESDAKDLLEKCGTAFVCGPTDRDAMIRYLDQAYQLWKSKAAPSRLNKEFLRMFERRNLTRSLAREFDAVLGAGEPHLRASSCQPAKSLELGTGESLPH